ncbi:hypothetical protein [Halpernia sp. GG3]
MSANQFGDRKHGTNINEVLQKAIENSEGVELNLFSIGINENSETVSK